MKNILNKNIIFTLLIFLSLSTVGSSQENFEGMFNLNFGYGVEWPEGDMKDRYGRNLKISIGAENIMKSKIFYGLDFDYKFGGSVVEDVFEVYRLENGTTLLGSFGGPSEVIAKERGLYLGVYGGKIITFNSSNLTGIRLAGGVGILQHMLNFNDDTQSFEIINGEYSKGYDRLTRGMAVKGYLGYALYSKDKKFNMNIGIEYTLGFTKAVREINFDSGLSDTKNRKDHLIGLKAEILLPFFKTTKEEIIYY
jgi:hypothetical protein